MDDINVDALILAGSAACEYAAEDYAYRADHEDKHNHAASDEKEGSEYQDASDEYSATAHQIHELMATHRLIAIPKDRAHIILFIDPATAKTDSGVELTLEELAAQAGYVSKDAEEMHGYEAYDYSMPDKTEHPVNDKHMVFLDSEKIEALQAALINEIYAWQDADCGERQKENDKWVELLKQIKSTLPNDTKES